jgi:hypothetical protein
MSEKQEVENKQVRILGDIFEGIKVANRNQIRN